MAQHSGGVAFPPHGELLEGWHALQDGYRSWLAPSDPERQDRGVRFIQPCFADAAKTTDLAALEVCRGQMTQDLRGELLGDHLHSEWIF